jgi:hypothetical protein
MNMGATNNDSLGCTSPCCLLRTAEPLSRKRSKRGGWLSRKRLPSSNLNFSVQFLPFHARLGFFPRTVPRLVRAVVLRRVNSSSRHARSLLLLLFSTTETSVSREDKDDRARGHIVLLLPFFTRVSAGLFSCCRFILYLFISKLLGPLSISFNVDMISDTLGC